MTILPEFRKIVNLSVQWVFKEFSPQVLAVLRENDHKSSKTTRYTDFCHERSRPDFSEAD